MYTHWHTRTQLHAHTHTHMHECTNNYVCICTNMHMHARTLACRDWIEQQDAKAEAAAAAAQGENGAPKKRGYTRRCVRMLKLHQVLVCPALLCLACPLPVLLCTCMHVPCRQKALPPAETAGDATRNMLEARALSNKINYSALADLFAEPAAEVRGRMHCARWRTLWQHRWAVGAQGCLPCVNWLLHFASDSCTSAAMRQAAAAHQIAVASRRLLQPTAVRHSCPPILHHQLGKHTQAAQRTRECATAGWACACNVWDKPAGRNLAVTGCCDPHPDSAPALVANSNIRNEPCVRCPSTQACEH